MLSRVFCGLRRAKNFRMAFPFLLNSLRFSEVYVSHFTPQVRLFSTFYESEYFFIPLSITFWNPKIFLFLKKKSKIFGFKNVMERGIKKNSLS